MGGFDGLGLTGRVARVTGAGRDRLAVLLASDLARCVTGQFILADAGAFLSRSRPANVSLSDPAPRQ